MRFIICFLIISVFIIGCADNEKNDAGVILNTDAVITTDKRIEALTAEERGKKFIAHAKKYLQLKDKSPKAALIELKKAAAYSWWNHPLSEEWAELIFRIDIAGEASIMDMIQRVELELQMAKDRSPYKEQVPYLEGLLEDWQERKALAEANGQNPKDPSVKWKGIRIEEE